MFETVHTGRTGFTLVELMVTTSAMTVLGTFGLVAVQSATTSANVAQAKAEASAEARALASHMAAELELARKNDPYSTIERFEIIENPVANCPLEVAFVVPAHTDKVNAHRSIRYRYMNEDTNGNDQLDPGEDTVVADGLLTRRVLRIETVRDPETGESREITTIVGGAHDVSDVRLTMAGNLLKIAATSCKPIKGTHAVDPETSSIAHRCIEATSVARVYLMN